MKRFDWNDDTTWPDDGATVLVHTQRWGYEVLSCHRFKDPDLGGPEDEPLRGKPYFQIVAFDGEYHDGLYIGCENDPDWEGPILWAELPAPVVDQ